MRPRMRFVLLDAPRELGKEARPAVAGRSAPWTPLLAPPLGGAGGASASFPRAPCLRRPLRAACGGLRLSGLDAGGERGGREARTCRQRQRRGARAGTRGPRRAGLPARFSLQQVSSPRKACVRHPRVPPSRPP